MIGTEIVIFIASILLGIVLYWRESKNNKIYLNKITHSKELQMKADNPRGFLYMQPFLMRLVYIAAAYLLAVVLVTVLTPINLFVAQWFITAIVGTLIGTYIASAFFVTKKGLTKENLLETVQKGKDFIEDLAEGKKDAPEPEEVEATEAEPEAEKATEPEPEEPPKKSARERLKDKGMIN